MVPRKVTGISDHLGRRFHFDLFEGARPTFAFVLLGGSGVSPEEYERRERSLDPRFAAALETLRRDHDFSFAFVCGPADGIFGRIEEDEELRAGWTAHVRDEVLATLGDMPAYLAAHSGGAQLLCAGPHALGSVIGVAALGADALPTIIEPGSGWRDPTMTLVYNLEDRVFGRNRAALADLEESGAARVLRQLHGGHELADYVANGSLGGLVRRAARLVRR